MLTNHEDKIHNFNATIQFIELAQWYKQGVPYV